MKKIVLILTMMGMVFSSCSSDSKESIKLNNHDLYDGNWYIKEFIKPDGTKAAYVDNCTIKRDYVEFYFPNDVNFYKYYSDCAEFPIRPEFCTQCRTDGDRFYNCMDMIDGTVSKLSNGIMQIDYGESRDIRQGQVNDPVIGIVLVRQK